MNGTQNVLCSLLLILVLLSIQCKAQSLEHMEYERRIREKILGSPNDKNLIPINKVGEPVVVAFHATLVKILHINEKDQYIEVSLWVYMSWRHPLMSWTVSEYGGLGKVFVSTSDIWLPDIVMINRSEINHVPEIIVDLKHDKLYLNVDPEERSGHELNTYSVEIPVKHDGTVAWMKPVILRTPCTIDVTYFPYDDQVCQLKFSSWSKNDHYLDIKPFGSGVTANYVPNNQWKLLNSSLEKSVKGTASQSLNFIVLELKIRRVSKSYTVTIVLPSVLLSSLALLTFVLPPEGGERVSLCITVILSMTVFQQLTAQIMPEFALPYLECYFFATLIVTAISLIVTTLILNIYHRSTRRTPKFIRRAVIDILGSILFCDCKNRKRKGAKNSRNTDDLLLQEKMQRNSEYVDSPVSDGKHSTGDQDGFLCVRIDQPQQDTSRTCNNDSSSELEDPYEIRRKEWLKVARVLDRLFFIVFSLMMVITFLAVFLSVPRFTE